MDHHPPSGLNPDQRHAARHRGSHLLIVAGAGTGKTRTLVARVVDLIETGVDPSRIQLLTFTRRASAEMVGRVAAACDDQGGTTALIAANLAYEMLCVLPGVVNASRR